MPYCILSVAYPFAPVAPDTAGGAEQVLVSLDAALTAAGHHSIVIASESSRVAGTLVSVPISRNRATKVGRLAAAGNSQEEGYLEGAAAATRIQWRQAIDSALERWPVDLIHMHGVDFDTYLPPPGAPVLATLHLPIAYYSSAALDPIRPQTWLHCVSSAQHADIGRNAHLLAPIENGVDVDSYALDIERRDVALMLARICPEKGIHLAIEAAKRADMALLIAGALFPYEAHQRYFETEVLPRLDEHLRYIGPVGRLGKRRLLASARCVLIASTVAETSSLVAREAAAAGTPVVALARGALRDTIEPGRTGFLVDTVDEMAVAMTKASTIKAALCRDVARRRFALEPMIRGYFAAYGGLIRRRSPSHYRRVAS